jgi:hypothetical protein
MMIRQTWKGSVTCLKVNDQMESEVKVFDKLWGELYRKRSRASRDGKCVSGLFGYETAKNNSRASYCTPR